MTQQSTEELLQQLNKLQVAERHRNEHLDFMARMFSHNLRSPVSGLKMLFRLLDMVEGDEREMVIDNIKDGSDELFSMIDDLAVVFLDYGVLLKEKEKLDFNEIINGVKSDLDDLLTNSGGQIEVDFKLPHVHYHIEHIRIILTELITNSVKFCPEDRNPHIEIKSYEEDGKLMLSVGDNGCGIDIDRHERDLFKMYKPLSENGEKSSKGIGLFRVKNLVEMNGGKIEVVGIKSTGTRFNMELYRL